MTLNPIVPGLRNIHHNANSAAKVEIVAQADDVLIVGDEVADQLLRHSVQFREVSDEQVEFIQQQKLARAAVADEAGPDEAPDAVDQEVTESAADPDGEDAEVEAPVRRTRSKK